MVHDRPFEGFLGFVEDPVQEVFNVVRSAVDGRDGDPGPLPFVLEVNLRDGDVVAAPDAIFETLEVPSLVLEGTGIGE